MNIYIYIYMNRFWESCSYGIYMNIIFYIKNLKRLLQANKKFVPTFRLLRLLQGNVITRSRPLNR